MSIFKRRPKIIKGHSFNDYLDRYGKGYINCKNEIITDKKKLKPNGRYYEIKGKYYQIDRSRWIRNILITVGSLSLASTIYLPIHFLVIAPKERYQSYDFKYWDNCESLNTLKSFVRESVTPSNKNYVPRIDRIATFDMDGTLFGERAPIYIEWMMYKDYFDNVADASLKDSFTIYVPDPYDPETEPTEKTINPGYGGNGVAQEINDFMENHDISLPDLEMNEAYAGAHIFSNISIKQYLDYVDSYLDKKCDHFTNLVYKDMFYKPMIEVVNFLKQNKYTVYIVSGTDRFMVRDIINKHIDIPYQNVIGMDVQLKEEGGIVKRTDKLLVKNVENAKVELISQEIGKKPILSFGNSKGDIAMNNFTLSNDKYKSQAYMVLADDNVREYCRPSWEGQKSEWLDHGYQIFSMKDDWKTIYGNNVARAN